MSKEVEKDLRYQLDDELRSLLPEGWHLYFDPPGETGLLYPALVYIKASGDSKYANNLTYKYDRQYELTCIYEDPDDETPANILKHFAYCRANRHFVTANLHHDTMVLYY